MNCVKLPLKNPEPSLQKHDLQTRFRSLSGLGLGVGEDRILRELVHHKHKRYWKGRLTKLCCVRVAFRVDANEVIGTGHLHRCRNIARELNFRGHETALMSGRAVASKSWDGQRFVLSESVVDFTIDQTKTLTPDSQVTADASSAADILKSDHFDLVVVDHYSLSDRWVNHVQAKATMPVLVIDDLGRHWSSARYVLDSALDASVKYPMTNQGTTSLLGPSYVPLHPRYKALAPRYEVNESVSEVVLFFGGVDAPNATSVVLSEIVHLLGDDCRATVIVGEQNQSKFALKSAFESEHVRFVDPADSLFDYLAKADLAIGAGGTATWERLCAGVPSMAIAISENQVPGSQILEQNGCQVYLGRLSDLRQGVVSDALRQLMEEHTVRHDLCVNGQALVDGFGASRICEAIFPQARSSWGLRPASEEDCVTYFRWVNDAAVRESSLERGEITWSTHQNWFFDCLTNREKVMLVAQISELPVGQIRFEKFADGVRLSYSVDSSQRGRGIGRWLVEEGIRALAGQLGGPVIAEVRKNNEASARVFQSLGFQSSDQGNGVIVFTRDPSPIR